jgi:replicative DNA helicase
MSITKLFADDTNEKILLATITSSKSALNKAMLLNLDDIYYEKNRLVFGAIQELYREGKPVDMTTVSNRMSQDNTFEKVGGHSYISEIVKTGTTIFIESCIDNIIENSKKRKIKDLATDTIEKIGTSLSEDVSEDIERAIREINRNRSNEFFYGRDLRNVDLDVWRQDEHHISTGYVDLDGLLTDSMKVQSHCYRRTSLGWGSRRLF